MKNLILFFTLFGLYACHPVFAALSDSDKAQVSAQNRLTNPGFENNKSGWTASGGSFGITSSALNGKLSATWDSSATSQTLSSTPVTINDGLKNSNGYASCDILVASGVATHKLQVYDGTNVLAEKVITSSITAKNKVEINFIFPASGTVRSRLISVASNEPSVTVDDCKLEPASNVYQVSQAQLVGTLTYAATASCSWNTASSGVYVAQPVNASCPTPTTTGEVQALASKIPGLKLANVQPGRYRIEATSQFTQANLATGTVAYRFFDGTSYANQESVISGDQFNTGNIVVGEFEYSSAQSNVQFEIYSKGIGGAFSATIFSDSIATTFSVYYFPSQAQTLTNVTQSQSIYSGDIGFAAGTSNATVFADINMTTQSLVAPHVSQNAGTLIPYASGLGVTFTPKVLGTYEICFDVSFTHNTSAQNNTFVVYSGGAVIGTSVTAQVNSATDIKTLKPCGKFTASSISPLDLHVMFNTSAGTMSLVNAGISLTSISSMENSPVMIGSVKSQSSSEESIFRIKFAGDLAQTTDCTTGTCVTVDTNSSGSSVTHAGPGVYDINLASGLFSAPPTCTCVCGTIGVGPKLCYVDHVTASSSLIQASCYTPSTVSAVNGIMAVQCMGPK